MTHYHCVAGTVDFDAFASARRGVASSSAAMRTDDHSPPPGGPPYVHGSGAATSQSRWRDRLTFSAGPATSVDVTLRWAGYISAVASATGVGAVGTATTTAYWSAQAFGPDADDLLAEHSTIEDAAAYAAADAGGGPVSDRQDVPFAETPTFHLPLVGSGGVLPYLDLHFLTYSSVGASGFALGGPTPSTARGEGVARHAAAVTALTFRDAGGRDVTSSVEYTFANGLLVGPVAAVPEPATWALVGAGLAGVAGAARRRAA